ncbi:MAG: DUF488 family protein [Chitinivibrionales bacterium]|nr:DUF488 family protein [Chitinivibrionales bacterium]
MRTIHTIGHSTHSIERLIELLTMHSISAVVDVRSSPYSRFNPQFNKEPLQNALRNANIGYAFMGRELGARSPVAECYINGKVQFDLVAKTGLFRKGLERLKAGIDSCNSCLLCAEKDPLSCHRMVLVSRNLRSEDLRIEHILDNGSVEDNRETEMRLRREHHIDQSDLFASDDELIEKAYALQGEKVAYTEKNGE